MIETRVLEGIGSGDKRALFIYLLFPFLGDSGSDKNDTRVKSARALVSTLNNLGYSVDVVNNDYSGYNLDIDEYDLLFGQGELFEKIAKRNPNTCSIYYATGRYKTHIEGQLENRKRKFKERKGKDMGLCRKGLGFNEGAKYADGVLALGSSCSETYQEVCDNRESILFEPSTYIEHDLGDKDFKKAQNNFLFFSGAGPLLKGLDLALDAFTNLSNYNLYISGPQIKPVGSPIHNQPFISIYRDVLSQNNIIDLQWLEKDSDNFREYTNLSNFVLSFSMSEGTNMSVLACMRRGMIPIVTEHALDSDVPESLIIKVEDDVDSIKQKIKEVSSMNVDRVKEKSYAVAQWAEEELAWDGVEKEIERKMKNLLKGGKK